MKKKENKKGNAIGSTFMAPPKTKEEATKNIEELRRHNLDEKNIVVRKAIGAWIGEIQIVRPIYPYEAKYEGKGYICSGYGDTKEEATNNLKKVIAQPEDYPIYWYKF